MSWNQDSPNLLSVKVKQSSSLTEYYSALSGDEGFLRIPQGITVLVTGPIELIVKRSIKSLDRFCEYEESDLAWALPLKLCRVVEEWLSPGDLRKLSEFAGLNYFYPGCLIEADLRCASMNYNKHGPGSFAELEFEVIGPLIQTMETNHES